MSWLKQALHMHIGGILTREPKLENLGGCVHEYGVDLDLVSYFLFV